MYSLTPTRIFFQGNMLLKREIFTFYVVKISKNHKGKLLLTISAINVFSTFRGS
jgi:hypothetical protein